jgi:hypothetical protein
MSKVFAFILSRFASALMKWIRFGIFYIPFVFGYLSDVFVAARYLCKFCMQLH